MKAFVYEADKNGRSKCGTGRVTPEYKTLKNLKRHYLKYLPPGIYNVEVFYNWDNRYGEADIEFQLYKSNHETPLFLDEPV